MDALHQVPVISKNRLDLLVNFLTNFAETVGSMGLNAWRLRKSTNALVTERKIALSLAEDAHNANEALTANEAKYKIPQYL